METSDWIENDDTFMENDEDNTMECDVEIATTDNHTIVHLSKETPCLMNAPSMENDVEIGTPGKHTKGDTPKHCNRLIALIWNRNVRYSCIL